MRIVLLLGLTVIAEAIRFDMTNTEMPAWIYVFLVIWALIGDIKELFND